MTPGIRALVLSLVVLVIGLFAVYLEVEQVRSGERLRRLLLQEEAGRERLRRLETRFITACSPDLLLKELRVTQAKGDRGEKTARNAPQL